MTESIKKREKYFKNSIAGRLTLYILLFSSVITLLSTSLQLYLYYSEDVDFIKHSMNQVKTSHLQSITSNLWVFDKEHVEAELKDILGLPDMQHIQIVKDDKALYSFGIAQTDNIISQNFPLEYQFKGKSIDLGTLQVVASLNGVYQRLYDKVLVILTTQAIKTFMVSFFILFLFYRLVGRHLNKMAQYANNFDLDHLDRPLVLKRIEKKQDSADELTSVVSAMNAMRINLKNDIDDRTKILEELKKSHSLLDTIIEGTSDAIFLKDAEGHYLEANKATLEAIGKSKEEVIGKKDVDLFPLESAQVIKEGDAAVLESGHTHLTEERLETAYGDSFWLVNKSPFRDENNTIIGLIGVSRNITELKKIEKEKESLETRLQQAQKMEAIGTLAGGIAHDFNNILSAILGYADLAYDDASPDSPLARYLDKVREAGYRAVDLVKQILAFSRQAEEERIPFQPASVVKEGIKMLRSSIPTTIEIHEDIDVRCAKILADPTQIHQILMNLCTNSFHAMEERGGKLYITLKDMEPGSEADPDESGPGGEKFVELEVRDTGPGIDPSIVDKIFEPYFTTKETGKGTGMGLAIVHGIIKSYGGKITVESSPGTGSTFHVFFPVSEREEVVLEEETGETIPCGTERILFVDDEDILVEIGTDMLGRLGYTVVPQTSSLEALETFQKQPDQFDLVITDQTMPGITGEDLARRILRIRPDMPIILCTGYSTIMSGKKAREMGIKEFVLKPLVIKDIAKLIRKVLDGAENYS